MNGDPSGQTPQPLPAKQACSNRAQWPTGWERMDAFGQAYQWFEVWSNSELSQCFTNLRNSGKKLVVAAGALKEHCTTAYECWQKARPTMLRIVNTLHFTVDYIEIDEPLTAKVGDYNYAVQQTAEFIRLARLDFPGIGIVLQESYPVVNDAATLKNFFRDVNAQAKTLTGTGVQYAQLDHDTKAGGSGYDVASIQNSVRANGMKFGVIFWRADKSKSWYQGLIDMGLVYRSYRTYWGVSPDMLAVINWTGTPNSTLPESTITGERPFTNSVRDFSNAFAPYPTSQFGLRPNEQLTSGQSRTSVDGRFRLIYQPDGNLVLYFGSQALWASNTSGRTAGRAVMQSDGNFVVYDASGVSVWSSKTNGKTGAFLVVQSDGNAVIYQGVFPQWSTLTNRY